MLTSRLLPLVYFRRIGLNCPVITPPRQGGDSRVKPRVNKIPGTTQKPTHLQHFHKNPLNRNTSPNRLHIPESVCYSGFAVERSSNLKRPPAKRVGKNDKKFETTLARRTSVC